LIHCPTVILENFVLKIYSESISESISESVAGCHTDSGGISALIEKLSGRDVSFGELGVDVGLNLRVILSIVQEPHHDKKLY
jgi:hypothetical protein